MKWGINLSICILRCLFELWEYATDRQWHHRSLHFRLDCHKRIFQHGWILQHFASLHTHTLVVVLVQTVLYKSRDKPRSPRHAQYDQMKKASSLSPLVAIIQRFYCIITEVVKNNSISASDQTGLGLLSLFQWNISWVELKLLLMSPGSDIDVITVLTITISLHCFFQDIEY